MSSEHLNRFAEWGRNEKFQLTWGCLNMWPKGRGSNWLIQTVDIRQDDGLVNKNYLTSCTQSTDIFFFFFTPCLLKTSHPGAVVNWWRCEMCVYMKDINFPVSLKTHRLCRLLKVKVQKTGRSDSRVPLTLFKLDSGITDNNWAVFFDLDTSQGRNKLLQSSAKTPQLQTPNSVSWPGNRLLIPTKSVRFRMCLSSARLLQSVTESTGGGAGRPHVWGALFDIF